VEGGVQLGPLGTAAIDWPIVACPGWLWWWRIWWNEDWQRKPKYSEKTRPSATLSTKNPTWIDLGSNPGRRGGTLFRWSQRKLVRAISDSETIVWQRLAWYIVTSLIMLSQLQMLGNIKLCFRWSRTVSRFGRCSCMFKNNIIISDTTVKKTAVIQT
jgi:hypothetical protein